VNYLRFKINLRTSEQPFTIKARMPSSQKHFGWCRRVKISQLKCTEMENKIIKRQNLGPKNKGT